MLERMCTLCAAGSPSKLLRVSDSVCEESTVDSLITKYLHIEIRSNFLCSECFAQLEKFHKYYKRVHALQKKFSILAETKLFLTNSENKIDVHNSSATNCSISCVKEEPNEIIDVFNQVIRIAAEQTKNVDYKKIDEDYYENENKDDLDHNQEQKIHQIEAPNHNDCNNQKPTKRKRCRKDKNKDFNDVESIKQETESVVSSVAPDNFKNIDYDTDKDHDDKICKFMDLICTICKEKFPTFNQIKRHYHNIHQTRGYISCCDLKFYTREELVDHIDCYHFNSDRLKCHICGKKLVNTRSLKRHLIGVHHIKKEDLYPCDVCPNKSFSNRIDLKKHKFEQHATNKYVCLKCKRTFKGEMNLRLHEENICNRERAPRVCDFCGKVYKSSSGFYKHINEVHKRKVEGLQECDKCGKLVNKLEFHKKMVHPPEGTIIKCKQCDKEMKTMFALRNHQEKAHRIEKRNFSCNICSKAFKRRKLLLEHTACHTGQPLYTCNYCPRTFQHGSNYLKHKKSQHANEWAEEKKLKCSNLKDNK